MQSTRFFTLGILFIGFVALTGCKKEEGPVGPQGPAGPSGEDANYAIGEYFVEADDFQNDYVEFSVDIITEDISDSGVVLVYVLDQNGYWNSIPNQWTPIIGYSFIWYTNAGGFVGLDHDPDVVIGDYTIRVVTMFQRSHQEMPADEIVQDYDLLMNFLSSK